MIAARYFLLLDCRWLIDTFICLLMERYGAIGSSVLHCLRTNVNMLVCLFVLSQLKLCITGSISLSLWTVIGQLEVTLIKHSHTAITLIAQCVFTLNCFHLCDQFSHGELPLAGIRLCNSLSFHEQFYLLFLKQKKDVKHYTESCESPVFVKVPAY